ncbi:MAG: hypothetical protein J5594_05720 [Elusimicrobiaceae bacterium]|nr:hypothetical protein [Elusimicrobiaceae bacterium]MBR4151740.1 hypothetical protein [Selenomonadaceae bacterium]
MITNGNSIYNVGGGGGGGSDPLRNFKGSIFNGGPFTADLLYYRDNVIVVRNNTYYEIPNLDIKEYNIIIIDDNKFDYEGNTICPGANINIKITNLSYVGSVQVYFYQDGETVNLTATTSVNVASGESYIISAHGYQYTVTKCLSTSYGMYTVLYDIPYKYEDYGKYWTVDYLSGYWDGFFSDGDFVVKHGICFYRLGALRNFPQGPNGWRLPMKDELQDLINTYGMQHLRADSGWYFSQGDNSSGFDLRPLGGYIKADGVTESESYGNAHYGYLAYGRNYQSTEVGYLGAGYSDGYIWNNVSEGDPMDDCYFPVRLIRP